MKTISTSLAKFLNDLYLHCPVILIVVKILPCFTFLLLQVKFVLYYVEPTPPHTHTLTRIHAHTNLAIRHSLQNFAINSVISNFGTTYIYTFELK